MNLDMIRENKGKTILQFSIPAIISMVLTSMITLVDGFFIGNYIGKEGIAAVNLGLPIVYLFLAVGLMLSVGGSAISQMLFGAGEVEKCKNVFNQTMATTILMSIAVSVVTLFCFHPMLRVLNANEVIIGYFKDYYLILLLQLPIMVVNSSFGMFIRGEGDPQFFMKVNVLSVLINVALDYWFTRWLGLGVRGIAIASLIATVVGLLCNLYFFQVKAKVYRLGRFSFSKEACRNMILNGSSEFIGEIAMCISMFAYNYVIMKRIGVDGVTAFTIVGYVSYLFSMVVIGFGQGSSPIMSFAYGAKDWELAKGIRRKTNEMVLGCGIVVMAIMFVIIDWYSSVFVKDTSVREMVHSGMMIFMVSFLFSGINSISSMYFTSIGKAKESAIISASRGLVILLICIFVLPVLFGMTGIWLVAPVTEVITILLTIMFITTENRRTREA